MAPGTSPPHRDSEATNALLSPDRTSARPSRFSRARGTTPLVPIRADPADLPTPASRPRPRPRPQVQTRPDLRQGGILRRRVRDPGQYKQMRGQYIPLSRAICCRPCIPPDVSSLPGVVGNVTADAVVALATGCQCRRASDPRVPSRGPSCPGDAFLQGFEADARANPTAPAEDGYFYHRSRAVLLAASSAPIRRAPGRAVRVRSRRRTVRRVVRIGQLPEAAAAAGALVHAFDSEMKAIGPFGKMWRCP